MSRQQAKKSLRQRSVKHDGILVHQRGSNALSFFVFTSTASQILSWAAVTPTDKAKGAAQRTLSSAHQKTIEAYIKASTENIIPTAVTLAIPPDKYKADPYEISGAKLTPNTTFATVTIDSHGHPGRIIDGQHRIAALEREEEIPLVCSLILGASRVEQALHFVVINNKAKKVPPDYVKSIIQDMTKADRTRFEERLKSVRLTLGSYNNALAILDTKLTSPFMKLLDWPANRDGTRLIKTLAIENSLREVMNKLGKGTIDIDMDEGTEILIAMWNGVRSALEEAHQREWGDETLRIFSKAGLVATTEYIVERLNREVERGKPVTDPDYVYDQAAEVISEIPIEFWTTKWGQKGLDTSAGRGMIRDAMAAVRGAANTGSPKPLHAASWFFSPAQDDDNDDNDDNDDD